MEEKVAKIYGYNLDKLVREACLANLRLYPFLVETLNSVRIDGKQKFAEKIIDKVAIEQRIEEIENCFNEVPKVYREAVKYCIFTKEKKSEKKFYIERHYQVRYDETLIWVAKALYLYARANGYPVPLSARELALPLNQNGEVSF